MLFTTHSTKSVLNLVFSITSKSAGLSHSRSIYRAKPGKLATTSITIRPEQETEIK